MALLQLRTGALKATAGFYLLIFTFENLELLSIPERAYTPFGILTAFIFFYIVILQLPNNSKNNSNNNKSNSNEKAASKAVG